MEKEMITIKSSANTTIQMGDEFDVVVVGGGFAGVAAALAAKRHGKSVLLIDKRVMLGGLATAGLISHCLALCDGYGRKIIGGLAEELMYTVIKYGYDTLTDEWRGGPDFVENPTSRYDSWFSIPEGVAAMEELLLSEGINILYDVTLTGTVVENGKCTAIITEEKGGKTAYKAKVFIDATGDATLFAKCGAKTAYGENLVSYGAHHMDVERCKKALDSQNVKDAIEIHWYGDFPVPGRERLFPLTTVKDSKDETEFIKNGRNVYFDRIKKDGKGYDHCTVLWPSMMLARKVRRIEGEYVLTDADVNKHVDDSIGCVDDWRNKGPIYEIPYRTLYTKSLSNVLAAGRCISSDKDAWEVTRVIPPAALTGQAAGTAAAMVCESECAVFDVDVKELQGKLSEDKILIHF